MYRAPNQSSLPNYGEPKRRKSKLRIEPEVYSYFRSVAQMAESDLEEELSWEDIQRLSCAFVICILGTAAHKGL